MTLPLFNVGGLMSGLDTNAIVDGLMQVERIPITQLEQRRSTYEAKDRAWQDVATRLSALRTALDPLTGGFSGFVTASSSRPDAAAVAVDGEPAPGSLTFTVDRLATAHQEVGGSYASADALVGAGDLTITIGGTDHVVTSDGSTTLAQLAQRVNDLDVGLSAAVIAVDATTSKLLLTAEDTGAAAAFSATGTQPGLGAFGVVQQGADAELTLGSGPGALTITRASNTVDDLVPDLTIELREASASPVTVTVTRDADAAAAAVGAFVDEMNLVLSTIGDLTRYDAETQTGGPLVGDGTARSLALDLRHALSGTVVEGAYPFAGSIGISIDRTGSFTFDEGKLRDALADDWDAVEDLFASGATAADSRLQYVSSTGETVPGTYEVVVTSAATSPTVVGKKYKKPASDTTFQIVVDAQTVDVTVTKTADIAEAVQAINDALAAAGVTSLQAAETTLPGGNDAIRLDDSRYGAAASFQVIGDPFGLTGTHSGTDAEGTIGGEPATGAGQVLTAGSGDPTGLAVRVSATQAEIDAAGGSLSLGDVVLGDGLAGAIDRVLDLAEGAGGRVARARQAWQSQIDLIDDRIELYEDRLDRREAALLRRFAALETAMATLQTQSSWLAAQLPGLSTGGGAP